MVIKQKLTMGGRIDYLDYAKAIGILLVVLRHTGISIGIFSMFHMPLFFIISGMFYKDGVSFAGMLKSKTNKLLLPWLFFYLFGYIIFYAVCILLPQLKNNYDGVIDVFVQRGTFNYPIWYLLCLFWVFVLYYAICKIRHSALRFCAIVISGSIGLYLGYYHIFLPCYIDTAFTSLPFFFIGYYLKKHTRIFEITNSKRKIIFLCASLALITVLGHIYFNPKIWLADNRLNPLCYIFSTTGALSLIFACMLIHNQKWLSYIGQNSLIILCWHNIIQRFVEFLFNPVCVNDLRGGVIFTCTIIISIVLIPISIQFIPWFVGYKNVIK